MAALRLTSQEECGERDRRSLTKLEWAPLEFSIRFCRWDFSTWESDFNTGPAESVNTELFAILGIRLKTIHHSAYQTYYVQMFVLTSLCALTLVSCPLALMFPCIR